MSLTRARRLRPVFSGVLRIAHTRLDHNRVENDNIQCAQLDSNREEGSRDTYLGFRLRLQGSHARVDIPHADIGILRNGEDTGLVVDGADDKA